jgi:hypothetical protein
VGRLQSVDSSVSGRNYEAEAEISAAAGRFPARQFGYDGNGCIGNDARSTDDGSEDHF